MAKIRIDQLVADQFHISVTEAAALIMANQVLVEDTPVTQPGTQVKPDVSVRIREKKRKYASRSGEKLEGALKKFKVSPKDFTVCDIGASNGGFTDCLLHHGATHVFAVDVAYGILEYRLRQDKRVTVLDNTNAKLLTPQMLGCICDMVTVDVSFISLKQIFPVVDTILSKKGPCITLIKPQFEAPKEALGKNGIVKDLEVLPCVFQDLIASANQHHLYLQGLMVSPIYGNNGAMEYLALWGRQETLSDKDIKQLTEDSIHWKPKDKS
ncbi:MAG: TlyA family RNA methyltransferase [Clostridia bacterium]|nr:TlyA family RNA methyltransferase [Clostridia bacterium]